MTLEITLLGPFQVTRDSAPVTQFEADTARALLAYLVMNAGTPFRREALADLLWPDQPTSQRAPRAAPDVEPPAPCGLAINKPSRPFCASRARPSSSTPDSDHSLDASRFATLMAATREHPHRRLSVCEACLEKLRAASELYRGDLLAGFGVSSLRFKSGW